MDYINEKTVAGQSDDPATANQENSLPANDTLDLKDKIQGTTNMYDSTDVNIVTQDQFANVPQILKNAKRWLLWQYRPNGDKKPRKVPVIPVWLGVGHKLESSSAKDHQHFLKFKAVLEAAEAFAKDVSGIGFSLDRTPLVGVDFDDCIKDGVIIKYKDEIERLMRCTYVEISPSGTGVKAIGLAQNFKKTTYDKEIGIEIYRDGRYFAITGNSIGQSTIGDIDDVVEDIVDVYLSHKRQDVVEFIPSSDAVEQSIAYVEGFLDRHDILNYGMTYSGLKPQWRVQCPWCKNDDVATITIMEDGRLGYNCFHSNSCKPPEGKRKGWRAYREEYEVISDDGFSWGKDNIISGIDINNEEFKKINQEVRIMEIEREEEQEQWVIEVRDPEPLEAPVTHQAPSAASAVVKQAEKPQRATSKPDKTNAKALLVGLGRDYTLWHSPDGLQYVTVNGTCYLLDSEHFASMLTMQYINRYGDYPSKNAVTEAIHILKAFAQHQGECHEPALRYVKKDGKIYVDLGTACYCVTKDGWGEVPFPDDIKFIRSPHMGAMPKPVKGGDINKFLDLLNADREQKYLILGWICDAMKGIGGYHTLFLNGEQGSAKSSMQSILVTVVDPRAKYKAERAKMPTKVEEIAYIAKNNHCVAFENVSNISNAQSDMICMLNTGGALTERKLYTNAELVTYTFTRPVITNGISSLTKLGDLESRAIITTLKPITKRISEEVLYAKTQEVLPEFLGCVFDMLSVGLRKPLEDVGTSRMVDSLNWMTSCLQEYIEPTDFVAIYEATQRAVKESKLTDDPVCAFIRDEVADGFHSATELAKRFKMYAIEQGLTLKYLPDGAEKMGNALTRIAADMRAIGIDLQKGTNGMHGKDSRKGWNKFTSAVGSVGCCNLAKTQNPVFSLSAVGSVGSVGSSSKLKKRVEEQPSRGTKGCTVDETASQTYTTYRTYSNPVNCRDSQKRDLLDSIQSLQHHRDGSTWITIYRDGAVAMPKHQIQPECEAAITTYAKLAIDACRNGGAAA